MDGAQYRLNEWTSRLELCPLRSPKKTRINFKEFKALPHALSLELNDTSISNPPFENYTGYLLSHGSYSKFSPFKIIHGTCPNHLSPLLQQYHLQQTLRSSSELLFTVPTVNSVTYGGVPFLSPHLYYRTV